MPAAGLPDLALASGATVIHVNKADVAMGDPKEFMLMGAAANVLPTLLKKIEAPLPPGFDL
jgi:NAD-dependent deacetylase